MKLLMSGGLPAVVVLGSGKSAISACTEESSLPDGTELLANGWQLDPEKAGAQVVGIVDGGILHADGGAGCGAEIADALVGQRNGAVRETPCLMRVPS